MGEDRIEAVLTQLSSIADELGEIAMDRLRSALDSEGTDEERDKSAVVEERRISRARRAVDKACAILRGPGLASDAFEE